MLDCAEPDAAFAIIVKGGAIAGLVEKSVRVGVSSDDPSGALVAADPERCISRFPDSNDIHAGFHPRVTLERNVLPAVVKSERAGGYSKPQPVPAGAGKATDVLAWKFRTAREGN